MTKCEECGTVYERELRYCPYCGIDNPDYLPRRQETLRDWEDEEDEDDD